MANFNYGRGTCPTPPGFKGNTYPAPAGLSSRMGEARRQMSNRWYGLLAAGTLMVMGAVGQVDQIKERKAVTQAVHDTGIPHILNNVHAGNVGMGAALGMLGGWTAGWWLNASNVYTNRRGENVRANARYGAMAAATIVGVLAVGLFENHMHLHGLRNKMPDIPDYIPKPNSLPDICATELGAAAAALTFRGRVSATEEVSLGQAAQGVVVQPNPMELVEAEITARNPTLDPRYGIPARYVNGTPNLPITPQAPWTPYEPGTSPFPPRRTTL